MKDKMQLTVSSSAFADGGNIPSDFTCDGTGKNPPITVEGVPNEAKSLVLIMDDPDAPGKTFDHWIVWNIKPGTPIGIGATPGDTGLNSLGENAYTGPCPPSGTHRYFFKVYALDALLNLGNDTTKAKVEEAMADHVIAHGSLMGRYRKRTTTA